jgi:exoribonuclease II
MRRHPLKGDRGFYAELTQFITFSDDHFVPGGSRWRAIILKKKRRTAWRPRCWMKG